jgi:tRNA-splicing ligase RtcB (3'-phosphate/5'-hydroxy nucleic acid ligase)
MERLSPKLLSWASICDDATREQALRTSTMPFIYPHMALMSDCHLGKGATVGSVIPTLGAIIPAAVGVDIGCVDADSEYLSPEGWRKISDYRGGKVMQYDPETGTGRFVQPGAYIVKRCTEFYRLKTKYGIDQMLSTDHRVLCWKVTGRARRRVQTVMTAAEFAAEHDRLKLGFRAEFTTVFTPELDTKVDLPDAQIRVQVMINADGTLAHGAAVLHLRKERKVTRTRELLNDAGITWTEGTHPDGTVWIKFRAPIMAKSFDPFWGASASQLAVITDECLHWYGNLKDRCFYTRDRASADFIQYALTACGFRAVLRSGDRYRGGETGYRVFANTNTMISMAGVPKTPITSEPSPDGHAYCFTVPSGFWVMRRGGNVVMTGNCGMQAIRTQFTAGDVRRRGDLASLREAIEAAIPLSAGKYNDVVFGVGTAERISVLEETAGADSADAIAPNWRLQLGSLGSGNHFIEVSLDELDRVWLFLHSGSRGAGNRLANKHINATRHLCERLWKQTLPDLDLAYLAEETDEFWAYIRDLRWAQKFALLNRAEMMYRIGERLAEWIGTEVAKEEVIECHHNYTEREVHWGKQVWLSRKGAIDASEGKPGLIPGSMGTASYIVTGLGNRLALNSAPHGAGRGYSRAAARRTFTRAQLDTAMEGIEWSRSDAFLDEIPGAYKPIDQVMADSADLVRIEHTLRQIVNVKGD